MANRPRWYRGGSVYAGAQRTVDRQFLLKPDDEIRNIVGAAAGRAQKKYPVNVYWLDFNINHKHIGFGPISDSPEHLQFGSRRSRRSEFFDAEADAVTNPVRDGLVDRVALVSFVDQGRGRGLRQDLAGVS